MSDRIEKPENVLARLTRRNWLCNAAIVATGAVVLLLFLTGCTKELQDIIKHPGGGLGSTPDQWYYLKATYRTEEGISAVGYFKPIGDNWTTRDYTEMRIAGGTAYATKFKVHTEEGSQYWETDDGKWLSMTYNGWAYRSDSANRVAWFILYGHLYNDYSVYTNDRGTTYYPLGSQHRGGFGGDPFIVEAYYLGVQLGDENVLTNCELVPAP